MSQVLLFPRQRPGRISARKTGDEQADSSFGDPIVYKAPGTTRLLFQNVKGLTHTKTSEDYKYYLSAMSSYSVDIFGMAETNTGWQHKHLQADFKACTNRQFRHGKAIFGYPTVTIDPLETNETFQAGGTAMVFAGNVTTTISGSPIEDGSGMGRWCGSTIMGYAGQKLSIITGYRTCSGSIQSSPLGSTFHREYMTLKGMGINAPQPRTRFLSDLQIVLRDLQQKGHAIILMMDANSTLDRDTRLADFCGSLDLFDLHIESPANSTYIGATNRRIDFIFGCERTRTAISRQGSLSYFEGPQSDHRGIYVDLNLGTLFGKAIPESPLGTNSTRDLQSGNPEKVAAYLEAMHRYYDAHDMITRIDHLYKNHRTMSRKQVRRMLTAWDNDQGRAMSSAESSLARPKNLYKWSPVLRNMGVTMRYWKLRLREAKFGEDYTSTFDRWERQIQQYDHSFYLPHKHCSLAISIIRSHLNQATKNLRQAQKDSVELRSSCYSELIDKYESDTDPLTITESQRKAKIVQRTIAGEHTRTLFAKLRQIVKPSEFSAISKIEIPRLTTIPETTQAKQVHQLLANNDPDSLTWDTIITKADIEEHLITFNREAFRAAAESPCGHGLIHDALSFTSLTTETKSLLYGHVPSEWYGDDTLLQEFLASFEIPNSVLGKEAISTDISSSDIVKGFKRWKESTTTSPSGRHLGHYKALIQDPNMLKCLHQFMQITLSRGISIPRWCKAINVMIEKDPGRPRIHRMRIIHLFEADYNLILKLMWGSRLVKQALKFNLLNPGQHGSVPGRTTMTPVMLNQLTTDLCRTLKINHARFDNDASACFDRIIVALGMMAARRCGMPTNAVRLHAKSLELMKYTVKTIYGISETSYSGTVFEPLFGTGQGSGASPSVWLTLVVILLNTLDRVIPDRISFKSIDGTIEHRRLVDAFVDDTAVGITDDGMLSIQDLIEKLETAAQTWEKLLHYSGGALNLAKCSWYVMYWDWRNGRPVLRKKETDDPSIQLTRGSGTTNTTAIKRNDLDTATRILGVHQTPVGDFAYHLRTLKIKADKYAGYLKSPRLSVSDIRVFHRVIYTPSMKYSLPAVAVDEEEWERVQSRIIPTMVNRLGMSSKLPTAIRHGPISMGGLGLYDLRTENGIEMIQYFRHEVFNRSQVGDLLLIQLQASQVEAGRPQLLLEEPNEYIPYLTPNWILSMRHFMSNHNISITVTDALRLHTQGPHDRFIMSPETLRPYTTRQQSELNLVRLYLQVTTISEMVDSSDPSRISFNALSAKRDPEFQPKATWPRQLDPSASQKRLWKRFIASNFLRYDRWWNKTPRLKPNDMKEQPKNESPKTIAAIIRNLPRTHRRMLSHVKQVATDDDIWRACRARQKITIASDGGLKDIRGTFGWNIRSTTHEVLLEGAGPVDGPFDTGNSTRSELGGFAASLLMLSILQRLWGTKHKCRLRWITDSKSAITNVTKATNRDRPQTKQPANPDYMAIIRQETSQMKRQIKSSWVKGHQGKNPVTTNRVKQDITANNHADRLATWYRESSGMRQSIEQTDHEEASRVSIKITGIRLTSQIEASIRFHVNGYHLRQYLQSKYAWTNSTWDFIDIEAFGLFHKKLRPGQQTARTKFVFDQWNTGHKRYVIATVKDTNLRLCPCCKSNEETDQHVLRCQQNPERDKSILAFRKAMSPSSTHPTNNMIKTGILAWLEEQEGVFEFEQYPSKFGDIARQAVSEQSKIGWSKAAKGFLSIKWRKMASIGFNDNDQDDEGQGYRSIRLILKAIHAFSQSIWKARNQVLHGSNDMEMKRIRQAELAEIQDMHSHPELVPAGYRHYCEQTLESLIARAPSTRRRWLRHMRAARQSMKETGNKQSLITTFFRSRSTTEA